MNQSSKATLVAKDPTVHVSPEMHRFLKMRAAATGTSVASVTKSLMEMGIGVVENEDDDDAFTYEGLGSSSVMQYAEATKKTKKKAGAK